MGIKFKIKNLLCKYNIRINDNEKQSKEACIIKDQIIVSITEYMKKLNSALIPYQVINDGFIKGINSVEQLKNLHIPNILISFLADNSVEIKKLDCIKKAVPKINGLKQYYLENRKQQFIDRDDLELYRNKQTGKIEFIAQIEFNNKYLINDICIAFIARLYNKRSKTHQVPKSGLVLISTADIYNLNKKNEISKYKKEEYIKVTGKMPVIITNDVEISYIEASSIEPSTNQECVKLIKR